MVYLVALEEPDACGCVTLLPLMNADDTDMSNQDDKSVVNIRFTSRLQLLRSAPMSSWIAISKDESHIIAVGKTFMEADEIARQSGEPDYFLAKTPDAWLPRA